LADSVPLCLSRWEPEVSFDDLVKEMVEADIALVEKGDLTS